MTYSTEQMQVMVVALRKQHETWLERISISCSTEIAGDIMQHLRLVQEGRFGPFATRCTPCRLLLKHVWLLR